MGNVVDYVIETKEVTFKDLPFQTEDALVLSEFCYLKFEGFVSDDCHESVAFLDICNNPEKEKLFVVKAYEKDNKKLFNAIVDSKRFRNMRIGYYVNRIDRNSETQFAAMTFYLDEETIFVAFRGTDETMTGWQEDFYMALKKPIKGQTLSARYLNTLSDAVDSCFYVGGHSKGGNLAMYSSICAKKSAREKIIKIYSFDGPGFRPEFLKEADYEAVKPRIIRIMPKSSPVGLLLNAPGEYEVIEAKSVGALQHNIYNWIIKEGHLVKTKMSEKHERSVQTVNEWVLSLDDETLMSVVEFLCWVLNSTDASTTEEFKENAFEHTKALWRAGKEADSQMKEMVGGYVKSYLEFAGESFVENVSEKYDAFMDEINVKYDEMTKEFKEKTIEAKEKLDRTLSATKEKLEESIEVTREKIDKTFDKKKRK